MYPCAVKRRSSNRYRLAASLLLSGVLLDMAPFVLGQQDVSASNLAQQFEANRVFWKQFEVAQKLVKLHDMTVLKRLEPLLKDEDRHVRGNAAFVFAGLGDNRGFEVILAILQDRSSVRPETQGIPFGNWTLQGQIASDRYYAVHLLGDLKDARAVPILIPLLKDHEVNWIVPWSLEEIGDRRAIPALIQTLSNRSADMRVLSIYALEKLGAREALPQLHLLLQDNEKISFDGQVTVAEAARAAIAKLNATH
ncbi:MAG: HEAT repeat domain-containing protein [Terracidiphilus sp.]